MCTVCGDTGFMKVPAMTWTGWASLTGGQPVWYDTYMRCWCSIKIEPTPVIDVKPIVVEPIMRASARNCLL